MAPEETATWAVTGPEGLATTPLSVVNSCSQVMPVVITTPATPGSVPPGTQGTLPFTGPNTGLLLGLAGALLLAGGFLTAAGARSLRAGPR
jgi:hypothetical protein